jgi:hypothetical protein
MGSDKEISRFTEFSTEVERMRSFYGLEPVSHAVFNNGVVMANCESGHDTVMVSWLEFGAVKVLECKSEAEFGVVFDLVMAWLDCEKERSMRLESE